MLGWKGEEGCYWKEEEGCYWQLSRCPAQRPRATGRDEMKANLSLYQRVALLGGSDQEDQVIKDLNRTFPKHHQFVSRDGMGQQSLFNILKAHVVFSPNVGYCQGMGFPASLLLFYMTEE